MFSTKSRAKSKGKRPASSAPASPQKPVEKSRASKPAAAAPQEAPEPQDSRTAPKNSSSLNPHLSFEGNLQFTGTVLVDCDFRGTVTTDDTLVVGVSGNLHAEVTAGVVEVSGKVHGNIRASSSVKVYSGGEVHGNIETPTISMEEGVIFEGNCTRPGSTPKPAPVVNSGQAKVDESPKANEPPRPAESKPSTFESSSLEGARKKMIISATELAEMR